MPPTFGMFAVHAYALREWAWSDAQNVTTFTWFAQIYGIGSLLVLYGSDYACSYTVALFPGIIPNFAVLHTEKLAFQ